MQDLESYFRDLAAILLSLTALFLVLAMQGDENMLEQVALISAIVCAILAVFLLVASMFIGIRRQKGTDKKESELNITIDTRDFITKDTEQIKAIFDGLEKTIKSKHRKRQVR